MKNDNQLYLKDVSIKILYTPNGKKLYWNKHMLWITYFNINRMQISDYFYIDGTFI